MRREGSMAAKSRTTFATIERTAFMIQGVTAILFGIAAVFWPGLTTRILVYLFASFLLIDGVVALVYGLVRLRHTSRALLLMLLGLLELGLGMYLVREPSVAFATFILILGFALIGRGVFSFVHAMNDKGSNTLKTMHALLGVLGLVIGIFVVAQPVAGGLAFVWIIGLYALVSGPIMIAMSSDLGKLQR